MRVLRTLSVTNSKHLVSSHWQRGRGMSPLTFTAPRQERNGGFQPPLHQHYLRMFGVDKNKGKKSTSPAFAPARRRPAEACEVPSAITEENCASHKASTCTCNFSGSASSLTLHDSQKYTSCILGLNETFAIDLLMNSLSSPPTVIQRPFTR